MTTITFSLPIPPSMNHYWRSVAMPIGKRCRVCGNHRTSPRVLISEEGRAYRLLVEHKAKIGELPRNKVTGRITVMVTLYPSNLRAMDLDNRWKGLLDSLKHAGVINDDADIDDLRMIRGPLRRNDGSVEVTITEIAGKATQSGELFSEVAA